MISVTGSLPPAQQVFPDHLCHPFRPDLFPVAHCTVVYGEILSAGSGRHHLCLLYRYRIADHLLPRVEILGQGRGQVQLCMAPGRRAAEKWSGLKTKIDYFNGKKTAQADWLDSSLGNVPLFLFPLTPMIMLEVKRA
jgi:hypothetical protein